MKNEIFAINRGMTLKEIDTDSFLLYNSVTKKHLIGSKQFADLIKKCNGTKKFENLVLEIAQEENQSTDNIRVPLEKIITRLIDDKIIEEIDDFEERKIRCVPKLSSFPLNSVYWEITSTCNFQCLHCYNSVSENSLQIKNKLNAFQTVDILAESGVIDILFTGGEPFMRTDLFDIIKYAKSKY
ncbi:hypothetical protein B6U93_03510, partial [Candidatus Woesearchaeota archaeon ex4484_78]